MLGSTILISLMAALQLPVVLSKLAYLIDNPWAVSLDRAWASGLILADSLIDRNLGTRPITLVGYSLGSRVILSCLLELARKGAHGLVQNVYIFGSPMVVNQEDFIRARSVVAGRFVNGYNKNDWILGYLFRLTNGGIRRIAGLASVNDIPGVENFDCTEYVTGHMQYRTAMPRLLRECGWTVESDEFGEIEDPDPERHRERQIELINEIEEARKDAEQPKKGVWGIFGRRKKTERQEWEVYEDRKKTEAAKIGGDSEEKTGNNTGVLFDVDAIRAEIAQGEEIQIKELTSTLPPMKLDVSSSARSKARDGVRETRSANGTTLSLPSDGPERHSYHHPESEVQMTFDSDFRESKPSHHPLQQSTNSTTLQRPELRPAHTSPNLALNDPWADDDDEDFGKEKEISMTFA